MGRAWGLLVGLLVLASGCLGPASSSGSASLPERTGVRIQGTVVDPSDAPVGHAQLKLIRSDGKYYAAETDGVGRFVFEIPPEYDCVIEVHAADFPVARFRLNCSQDLNALLKMPPRRVAPGPRPSPAPATPPPPSRPPAGTPPPDTPRTSVAENPFGPTYPIPHVIVGVPDTGINPYHRLYYRPDRIYHPCTYVLDFPCSIRALPLSVGLDDWDRAYAADKALWDAVVPGEWYWIPGTVFVAVSCESPAAGVCILDDTDMHGTGTTSSVIMENPDALIAFKEGGSGVLSFGTARIPVDIFSVSWGYVVPIPLLGQTIRPIYVKSAGNDGRPGLVDGWAGDPDIISVGGAYAADRSEEPLAGKQPEIVSYFCRPTAQTKETHQMRESYCGTSFAAPTAAGALSKVVLALRRASGYAGSNQGTSVDPIMGVTFSDLRGALNQTASYSPDPKYPNRSAGIPLNPLMPCLQWGWGFYDGNVADATIRHFLEAPAPRKSTECEAYMAVQHTAKKTLNGPF